MASARAGRRRGTRRERPRTVEFSRERQSDGDRVALLKRPRAAPQLPWSQAYINVRPAGRLRGDELAFTATAATNGEFWVDDVPMGKYSLSVWFGRVGAGRLLGHLFQVPSINEKLRRKAVRHRCCCS